MEPRKVTSRVEASRVPRIPETRVNRPIRNSVPIAASRIVCRAVMGCQFGITKSLRIMPTIRIGLVDAAPSKIGLTQALLNHF